MRVSINDKVHEIEFVYLNGSAGLSRDWTVALVSEITGWVKGKPQLTVRSAGAARKHPNDQLRKSTGRKLALRHALEYLPKEERKAIWSQLFDDLEPDHKTGILHPRMRKV